MKPSNSKSSRTVSYLSDRLAAIISDCPRSKLEASIHEEAEAGNSRAARQSTSFRADKKIRFHEAENVNPNQSMIATTDLVKHMSKKTTPKSPTIEKFKLNGDLNQRDRKPESKGGRRTVISVAELRERSNKGKTDVISRSVSAKSTKNLTPSRFISTAQPNSPQASPFRLGPFEGQVKLQGEGEADFRQLEQLILHTQNYRAGEPFQELTRRLTERKRPASFMPANIWHQEAAGRQYLDIAGKRVYFTDNDVADILNFSLRQKLT